MTPLCILCTVSEDFVVQLDSTLEFTGQAG